MTRSQVRRVVRDDVHYIETLLENVMKTWTRKPTLHVAFVVLATPLVRHVRLNTQPGDVEVTDLIIILIQATNDTHAQSIIQVLTEL